MMNNYPDDTYAGDPMAPWNKGDWRESMTCENCRYMGYLIDGNKRHTVCVLDPATDSGNDVYHVTVDSPICEGFDEV